MGLFLYFFGGSLFGFSLFSSEELEESGAGFEGFFSDLDGLFGASFLGFSSASSDELEESLGAGVDPEIQVPSVPEGCQEATHQAAAPRDLGGQTEGLQATLRQHVGPSHQSGAEGPVPGHHGRGGGRG